MRKLLKSPQAEIDLLDVWQYTFEAWGEQQADRYLTDLRIGMGRLLKSPYSGKSRDEIRAGYRSLQVGRHLIIYRVFDDIIDVIRVLHDRMDPQRHIEDGSES